MTDLFEQQDQTASEREELLNKWKDKSKEELLEAKINSDLFVKTLTRRQDEISKDYLTMKEQLDATASLQELRDQIVNAKASNSNTPANEDERAKEQPVDIDKRVREIFEETRRSERAAANAATVQNKMKEHFGDNYQTALRNTGLSDARIQEIAMESPEVIFKLVGLNNDRQETFQSPPRSAQRNDSFAPRGQTKRDEAYYRELKKSNPKLYLDPKIAVQMHNDAMEQGEAFFVQS